MKSNTHHPIWNERVHYTDYQQGDKLMFHVWDEDTASAHDHLGDVEVTPDCKQGGTKDLKLSKGGSLTIMIECVAPASEALIESMAKLAKDVYLVHETDHKSHDLGDWDLVQS